MKQISLIDEKIKIASRFENLFDVDEIQAIQDSFAKATGVASIITDIKGDPITKPSNFCRLCKDIIRKTEKGLSNCIESDAAIGCYNPDGPIVQPCLSGGLWDAGASINVAGKHIANWLIGQVRNKNTDKNKMMEYAQFIGADPEEFKTALEEVPVMSLKQFEQVSESLFLIANHLSKLAYQKKIQEHLVLEKKESEKKLAKKTIDLQNTINLLVTEIESKKKIEKDLKKKNEYMAALHETSLGMFSRLDVSQVLESIIKRASRLTQIPDGFVFIYDSEKNLLELKAACGQYLHLKGVMLRPGEGVAGKVWENGESFFIDDYQTWPGKSQNPQFDFVTTVLGVPLTSGSKIEGTIGLSHHEKEKKIDHETIEILEHFAELATIAIDNAKLFESMEKELDQRIELESEREKMETRLRQSQKMEAIGTLAGGIAHDFNNILFPVIGFSQMISDDLPVESPIKKQIQAVLEGAERAKDLVQQILTFSRQTEQEVKPLKIELILKEVLKLARASLPSTIKISLDIAKQLGMVVADPTQIHQVAMNLITNASHAMEENGGELKVTLSIRDVTTHNLPVLNMLPGSYICLEVSDTGSGMDSYTRARILEPYFTTKAKGKGTGLGLSVVHGIVKNLKGELSVQSRIGKGSSFLVYLPLIVSEKKDNSIKKISIDQLHGNERILLVDDERPVIMMVEQMLLRFGYQVTSKDQSLDALKRFQHSPYEFDLVITDMTMPELTGDKLIMEIKTLRPEIPVILCTGFSEKIIIGRGNRIKPDKILMKPVGKDDLLESIRFVLDKP